MRRAVVILLCGLVLAGCGEHQPVATPSPEQQRPTVGDHRRTLDVGGQQRTYLLHVPPGYRGDRPVPLVIGLHFYPGTGAALRDMIGMDAKADQHGFLTAYPDGVNGGYNALICCGDEDDVAFLKALTEQLTAEWRVDADRVYLTGISNGGDMSFRAAVEATGVFAAIGVVSGGYLGARAEEDDYVPRSPVSVVTIIGARDVYSDTFQTGIRNWQKRLRCAPTSAPPGGAAAVRRSNARCADGSEVEVYVVADLGHAWPGAAKGQLAAPDAPLVATDIVWDFFAAHPRRR